MTKKINKKHLVGYFIAEKFNFMKKWHRWGPVPLHASSVSDPDPCGYALKWLY